MAPAARGRFYSGGGGAAADVTANAGKGRGRGRDVTALPERAGGREVRRAVCLRACAFLRACWSSRRRDRLCACMGRWQTLSGSGVPPVRSSVSRSCGCATCAALPVLLVRACGAARPRGCTALVLLPSLLSSRRLPLSVPLLLFFTRAL